MVWYYHGKEITSLNDFGKDIMGFVYCTTHIPTGKSYIGKKFLVHTQKRKLTKKDLKIYEGSPGRPPKYKLVSKESDWKTYYGSNKQLLELLNKEKKENFRRDILHLCKSKKRLTYYETKYQFIHEVLERPDEYFNDNILGKFFTRDFGDLK